MALLGYARVSTPDQSLAPQLDALRAAGCCIVFQDHGVSGGSISRSGLDKLLQTLETGDTLVVWQLDRLGRSIRHLLEVVGVLRERGIELRSLTEAKDTSSASGRIVLHVMAAVAEFERARVNALQLVVNNVQRQLDTMFPGFFMGSSPKHDHFKDFGYQG